MTNHTKYSPKVILSRSCSKGIILQTQMVSSKPQSAPKWNHVLLRSQPAPPHKRDRGLLADTHGQVHPASTVQDITLLQTAKWETCPLGKESSIGLSPHWAPKAHWLMEFQLRVLESGASLRKMTTGTDCCPDPTNVPGANRISS